MNRRKLGGGKMRAFILGALATGLLAAAPVAASADTIVEDFTIPVAAGTSNGSFVSDPFPGFDPSLGTLTDVIETLAQSLTWIPGFTVNDASPAVLTVSLHSPISVSQTFTASTSEPQRLTLVLNAEASSIGSGSQKAVLSTRENSGFGRLSRTRLEGTMTYVYTPFPSSIVDPPSGGAFPVPPEGGAVPELSTWAMMLVGFASLGYASKRRKPARA